MMKGPLGEVFKVPEDNRKELETLNKYEGIKRAKPSSKPENNQTNQTNLSTNLNYSFPQDKTTQNQS